MKPPQASRLRAATLCEESRELAATAEELCADVIQRWGYIQNMARPPKDDDATKNLRPDDKTQRAKAGTKIGLLRRDEVMAAFRKIARTKPR